MVLGLGKLLRRTKDCYSRTETIFEQAYSKQWSCRQKNMSRFLNMSASIASIFQLLLQPSIFGTFSSRQKDKAEFLSANLLAKLTYDPAQHTPSLVRQLVCFDLIVFSVKARLIGVLLSITLLLQVFKESRPLKQPATLVYILGRGHSGSTVLDALLGNAKEIESVGELVSGIDRFKSLCSCHVSFRKCVYWQHVRRYFEEESGLDWTTGVKPIKRQAHVKNFLKYLFMGKNSTAIQKTGELNRILVDSISHAANKQCVVDSSKEVTRALFLLRTFDNVKVVHLIRNPERIAASDLHRIQDGTGFKFLRRVFYNQRLAPLLLALTSINWLIGNLLAELIRLLFPHQVLRIRYEDICRDPEQQLESIARFIGRDLTSVTQAVEKSQPLPIGHNIGGNRMRLAGNFVFDPRAGRKRPLPPHYTLMVRLITLPLLLFYGY